MSYWLVVFTPETWGAFKEAGGEVTGFPQKKWNRLQKVHSGDTLLAYISGQKRWIAVLKAVGEPFLSDAPPIWGEGTFPARIPVHVSADLSDRGGIPVEPMLERLTIFDNLRSRGYNGWGGFFMSPPTRWSDEDGLTVERAMAEALTA